MGSITKIVFVSKAIPAIWVHEESTVSSASKPRDPKQFPKSYTEMIAGIKIRWSYVSAKSLGPYLCTTPLLEAAGVEAASLVWSLSWTCHHSCVYPSQRSAESILRLGLFQRRKDSFSTPLSIISRWSLLTILQQSKSLAEKYSAGVLLK